jgi:hypothetical protein
MLSYYPPMSGDDDSGPIVFPVDTIYAKRKYVPAQMIPPSMGAEVEVCDVDKHGNLINCVPRPLSAGWEFDGSAGFGATGHAGGGSGGSGGGGHSGGGGAPGTRSAAPTVAPPNPTAATASAAASAHPGASPTQRQAIRGSAGRAAQGGVFVPPGTTRGFTRSGHSRPPFSPYMPSPPVQFSRARDYGRGWGGAYGMPRPWNADGWQYDEANAYQEFDDTYNDWDTDQDFGAENYFMHEISTHKPVVLGGVVAALGAVIGGPVLAAVGGIGGYLAGRYAGI